jgi:hypothetical protein
MSGIGVSNTWGITGSISVADGTTSSNAQATGTSSTVTRQDSNTISIPPLTKAVLEYYIYKIGVIIPFSMTVTIDADISTNDSGYVHLSDMIPDATKRTFMIEGNVSTEDGSAGDWLHAATVYTTANQCLGPQNSGLDAAELSGLTFNPLK